MMIYTSDEANYTKAPTEENHQDNMLTAANDEDKPHGDNPKMPSLQLVDTTTFSMIPATIILPPTFFSPPSTMATAATSPASATTSLDAKSASTSSSGSNDTSSQSSAPTTPATESASSDDLNPTLQQQRSMQTTVQVVHKALKLLLSMANIPFKMCPITTV